MIIYFSSAGIDCQFKSFRFFLQADFGDCLALFFQLLAAIQVAFPHLAEILLVENLSLLTIFGFFLISENVEQMSFEFIRVADID